MKKKVFYAALYAAILMVGCSPKTTTGETAPVAESKELEIAVSEAESSEEKTTEGQWNREKELKTLETVAALLNMQDTETAELFGGGEENWTEDRSFYIGRIFQVEIDGETYPVYTTCSPEGVVESVSMWVVNGRPVEDAAVQKWTELISEQTGTNAVESDQISEGGSRKKTWTKDGKQTAMYYMADIMTISIQNLIGELNEGNSGADREDNFAVDGVEVETFASAVKAAMAGKNMEELADLMAFPLYLGFKDGGVSINSKEEFLALESDRIFTDELLDAVAQADEKNLSPSRAGFVMTKETGGPNVVFGLRGGTLAISGINY